MPLLDLGTGVPGGPVRVLIVDDDRLVGELSQTVLRRAGAIVVGRASRLAEVSPLLEGPAADVALVDQRLPDGDGPGAIALVRARWPDCVCVLLTGHADAAIAEAAIAAGADGVMLKDGGPEELVELVHRAAAGDVLLDTWVAQDLEGAMAGGDALDPAATAVLQALLEHGSLAAASGALGVSEVACAGQLATVSHRLGGDRPIEVVVRALRSGLIRAPASWPVRRARRPV